MKNRFLVNLIPPKVLLLVLASLFVAGASFFRFFEPAELAAYDFRLKLKSPQKVDSSIALIEIGDDTLKSLGQWPIKRSFHAVLIDILRELGAQKIVLDVLFSEPSEDDVALAGAIKRAGNVYLPAAFDVKNTEAKTATLLAGITDRLWPFVAGVGHINALVDSDGKIRSIPLFVRYKGIQVPSLALRVAQDMGFSFSSKARYFGSKAPFFVNYPGIWTDTFRHFSYIEILKSYIAKEKGQPATIDLGQLSGKICIVGLTATGTADIRPNPLEKVYPMVGLQASVLSSLLTNNFIFYAGAGINCLICLLIFWAAAAVCFSFLPLRGFLWSSVLASYYFLAACALFIFFGIWVDLFFPIFVIALTYTASLFYHFLKEARKRELLENELEIAAAIQNSFLPKEVQNAGNMTISALLKPAKFVAGDLYDIIALGDNTTGILIADVSGKGVSAALVMAQAISLFRVFVHRYSDPAEVLMHLNKEMTRVLDSRFVTAQYIIVDTETHKVKGASAGHIPLLLYKRHDEKMVEAVAASGLPLGLDKEASYVTTEFDFKPGDRIFLYTDGWTEARGNKQGDFGIGRLREELSKSKNEPVETALKNMECGLSAFQKPGLQHDDITAVLLEAL